MIATYYKNIFAEEGSFMQISECLNRIKSGESKKTIEQIANKIDKTAAK
jgi:hypothetical protein